MCNKTRKETSRNRHESRLTFFENRPIIKEAAINTLLIFAFQEDWKKQEILRNSAENHCFSLRKNDAEKVVDTMGEELQEQLQTRILWESPFDVPLVGPIHISESVVMTWFLMAIIMVLVLILTRNLKIVPGKRQAFLEMAVTWLTNFFEGNMGKAGRRYVPYLSTVLIYLGIANMIGMFGFGMKPPTKDINVTVALALMSIILIEASTFRAQGGIKGFLKSFTKPMALLTPLNVMEIAIRPLSLCMRLFGNVLGAFVVMQLIEHVCGLIIPMVFSMYFDVFDGLIQAYVFVFLTSLFMAEGMEVEEESVPKLQQA
jgi:F-type H+-transporting ATPase subunit a